MSDALLNLVSSRLPVVGLLAYSIHSPNRVLATGCLGKTFDSSAAEEMLGSVIRTGRTLLPAQDESARYCWVFEQLRVYVSARADGICLALVVENDPGVQMARLQELIQDFATCDCVPA